MPIRMELNNKFNKVYLTICVLLFSLFYLSSGFGEVFSNNVELILLAVIDLGVVLLSNRKLTISPNMLLVLLALILNTMITTAFWGDETKQIVLTTVYVFSALVFVEGVGFRDFLNSYVKLLYFLCVCSLILWIVFMISPSLIEYLPKVTNSHGIKASTIIVSTIYQAGNVGIARNQGIFWEPGAFQTYINLALMLTLFCAEDGKKKTKYIIVYISTIITTFSTAGYSVALILLAVYLLNSMLDEKKRRSAKHKTLLVFVVLALIFWIIYNNLSSELQYQLFGKVREYFENSDKSNNSSTGVRMNSIIYSVQAFLKSPIIGNGVRGMDIFKESVGILHSDMGTCTPVNWFSYYGVVFGCIMNYGLFKFSKKITNKTLTRIALFIVILVAISSENYFRNPSILIFSLLGFKATSQNVLVQKKTNNRCNEA